MPAKRPYMSSRQASAPIGLMAKPPREAAAGTRTQDQGFVADTHVGLLRRVDYQCRCVSLVFLLRYRPWLAQGLTGCTRRRLDRGWLQRVGRDGQTPTHHVQEFA